MTDYEHMQAVAKANGFDSLTDAIAQHKAKDERIAALTAELARRQGDPITRLHNICEALQEDAKESPFSREEWERMDREQVRLTEALTFAKSIVCKSPFPLRCEICRRGNNGIGFDFCYLNSVLKGTEDNRGSRCQIK